MKILPFVFGNSRNWPFLMGPWLQNGPFWGSLDLGTGLRTARLARQIGASQSQDPPNLGNPGVIKGGKMAEFFGISIFFNILWFLQFRCFRRSLAPTPPLALFLSFVCLAASLLVEVSKAHWLDGLFAVGLDDGGNVVVGASVDFKFVFHFVYFA